MNVCYSPFWRVHHGVPVHSLKCSSTDIVTYVALVIQNFQVAAVTLMNEIRALTE